MIVTYTPSGQEPQTWTWDPATVRPREAEDIEEAMGSASKDVTFDEFQMLLLKGGARARRVLLWHLQRKTHPTLKLADVDFAMGELTLELQPQELQMMRDAIAKTTGVPEAKRDLALELLDKQIAEAGGTGPKASSGPSASATA